MKTRWERTGGRVGRNTVTGQVREGPTWTVQVTVIRTDDILDRHVLIHINFWSFIIYVKICDALHAFPSGTAGRIQAQSYLSKAFNCVQSHRQKTHRVRKRPTVQQHLLLPNPQSQQVGYSMFFCKDYKSRQPLGSYLVPVKGIQLHNSSLFSSCSQQASVSPFSCRCISLSFGEYGHDLLSTAVRY